LNEFSASSQPKTPPSSTEPRLGLSFQYQGQIFNIQERAAMVKAIDSLIQYVDKLKNSYTHSTILATKQHGYFHTLLKLSTSLSAFYANRITTYL